MDEKWLVCGGRSFNDAEFLNIQLDALAQKRGRPVLVIHGGAFGADTLAGIWAEDREIPCRVFPAKWAVHGRGAGPIRNTEMLMQKPDLVVAFPGDSGTANMKEQARANRIPTVTMEPNQFWEWWHPPKREDDLFSTSMVAPGAGRLCIDELRLLMTQMEYRLHGGGEQWLEKRVYVWNMEQFAALVGKGEAKTPIAVTQIYGLPVYEDKTLPLGKVELRLVVKGKE